MAADGKVQIVVDIVSGSGGTSKVRSEMGKVSEEAKRINRETAQQAKQNERVLKESAKSIADFEIREEKRKDRVRKQAHKDYLAQLRATEAESKASAATSSRYMSSAFKGGILGGFVGYFAAQFSQIPFIVKQHLDEAVKIAADRQNALKGLESISLFKGINPAEAEAAVKNLRLVRAGIVEIGDATTGVKNLLSSGFSLPEATKLMETFSDTAAFGKSAALTFGDAIRSATEGVRNGNSILVDNVGLTKNLTAILKDAGYSEQDLMRVKEDSNVRMALFNGLIKEAIPQIGDADKLTESWTGSTAALAMATDNLYGAVGNIIIQNPELLAAIRSVTSDLSTLTGEINNTDSSWSKSISSMTTTFAEFLITTRIGWASEIAEMKEFARAADMTANAVAYAFWVAANPLSAGANKIYSDLTGGKQLPWYLDPLGEGRRATYGRMTGAYNSYGSDRASAEDYERKLRADYEKNLKRNKSPYAVAHRQPGTPAPPPVVPPKTAPPGGGGGGGRGSGTGSRGGAAPGNGLSANARTIIAAAQAIGVSPLDYATFLLYEGSGSLSTSRWGGKNNAYLGPMQMGPEERAMYGRKAGVGTVKPGMSLENYLKAANAYLTGRGVKPGMGLSELYTAINYGNVRGGVRLDARDQNGTVREHLTRMLRDRRPQAQALLKGYSGGSGGSNIGDDVQRMLRDQSDALTAADKQRHLLAIINLYKTLGIIPTGETLKEIHAMMLEEARNSGVSTFGMSAEKTAVGFMKQFAPTLSYKGQSVKRDASGRLVAVDDGTIPLPTTGVSTNVSLRAMELSPGEAYIRNLRISLGLERESNTETTRGVQLLIRKEQIEAEIAARLEDQRMTRKETLHDLESEYQLLLKRNVAEDGQVNRLRDRNQLTREIQDMRDEIANGGANDGLIIQAAHLRDILDLRNRERDAVIAINRAQLELSKSMEISNNQIKAGVYSHLAAQKTLNQAIADGINQTHDAILQRMNAPLDKLNDKAKGMLSFITEPLKAMQANMLGRVTRSLVDVIFPGDSPIKDALKSTGNPVLDEAIKQTDFLKRIEINTRGGQGANGGLPGLLSGLPGLGGGKGAGTAGNLLNILMGGRGMGPGGTPMFNPNTGAGTAGNLLNILTGSGGGGGAASGTATGGRGNSAGNLLNILTGQGGGIGGLGGKAGGGWKGIFGKGGMFGKEGFGFNAGTGAGLGSIAMMAGSMIGGRMGNVLSMAGMGAQVGSLFGPWGSVIGAVGGAIIGLFTGGDNATKKLKEAAASEFGISVKDKKVLKQLKAVGEGMFGKGKAGENARAVVRSEQGQNILRAYAEQTGQSSLKIDRLNYGDPNWEGNNFRSQFGGFGSPTSSVAGSASMEASRFGGYRASGGSVRAGYSYVIGERGPETVTFARNATVAPNAGLAALDSKQMQAVMTATLRTLDRMADALDSFESMPVDEVVRRGAHGASRQIADAADRDFADDARRSERLYRNIGAMV